MSDWLNKVWPGQVAFFNEGVGASASSVGPGGNPALSGLGKLPAVLAHKPDVVFIEFATNDAYLPYKISLEDSKKNLNTIIDALLAANPDVEIIIQTMSACKDQPGSGRHASDRPRLADYFAGYREVTEARGLRLVDHYPNWLKIMTDDPARFDRLVPDRIHPQAEGYREVLLPALKAALLGGAPNDTAPVGTASVTQPLGGT
jgi:acyl-CoA thioesterase I